MNLAPIALFTYNRPTHTQRTVEHLKKNRLSADSDLYIFCDGTRNDSDFDNVEKVYEYIRGITGFKTTTIIKSEKNLGLAQSIIKGVTYVIEKHGKIIVLEDDILTSPEFLSYMNRALDFYEDKIAVWHISGWNYPIDTTNLDECFLWREMNCWGWGTWRSRWSAFEKKPDQLAKEFSKEDIHRFNLDGSHNFWSQVLGNRDNKINTWAIFWYATIFKNNGLCLNPSKPLVKNIGFDNTGENCPEFDPYLGIINQNAPRHFPEELLENKAAVENIKKFYRLFKIKKFLQKIKNQSQKFSWLRKIFNFFTKIVNLIKRPIFLLKKQIFFRALRNPITPDFGYSLGTPIDRFYIEKFLYEHSEHIMGEVLEVADSTYTEKFGKNVKCSEILTYSTKNKHHEISGDLTKKATLPHEKYDCFICTQTLNFIYDLKSAIEGIHHTLKPNGIALITVAGLTQISRYDMERWGDYWRFTTKSIETLFAEVFEKNNTTIECHGNSLSACYLIQGIPSEHIHQEVLLKKDCDYQIVITVVARK